MTARGRVALFAAVTALALAAAAQYVRHAATRPVATDGADPAVRWLAATQPAAPYLIFRSTLAGPSFGHVGYVPLSAIDGPRYLTPLSCERLFFRAGHGVCLTIDPDRRYPARAASFDAAFHAGSPVRLTGPPSRARVSDDGALAAVTVFESGHSYSEAGFSTRTSIVDLAGSRILTDLEQFEIRRNGARFKPVDSNFWGVTFIGASDFYATLSTGGRVYLVRGNVETRHAEVLREGVECPSVSPRGDRIAFKKRTTGRLGVSWQVAIVDLASGQETVLDQERRSVDDQVEWLTDDEVLYHQPSSRGADVWALRTDNSRPPRLVLTGSYSPAVVRE
jgi:hypothetical protein